MNRRRAFVATILLITAGALAIRLAHVEDRPMHVDEAVHTLKFQTLWETGTYEYDLNDFHGPTIYYAALPIVWLAGADDFARTDEWMFRLVPVVFGVGTILLLIVFRDAIGNGAAICAAVLTAVSPAMVFYSQYYIQESVLVFFTFGAIVCGWRYSVSRRIGWAVGLGLCVGLMHATKETCIIAFGCMFAALVIVGLMNRRESADDSGEVEHLDAAQAEACGSGKGFTRRDAAPICIAGGVAIASSIAMFSGVFTNWPGVWDSVRAYAIYFDRAGAGGIHEHPWHFYWSRLLYHHLAPGPVWSEALIVALGLFGAAVALRSRSAGLRFLAVYAVLMAIAYSAIRYKTPWCMLSFLHALVVMAGVGAVELVRMARVLPLRVAVAGLLGVGVVHLFQQAHRTITTFNCDRRNPYVYAHSVRDVVRLAETIEGLAAVHASGHDMLVRVISPDYWPIPWYLRRFNHVGYWETPPEDCDAPVIITSIEMHETILPRLTDEYFTAYYGLRPDVVLPVLIDQSLWSRYVASRSGPRSTQ